MNQCIAYSTNGKREFIETTQTEWAAKWNEKVMYYSIGICKSLTNQELKKALNLAFSTWEAEIDIKFHPAKVGQKPNFTVEFKSSAQDELFKKSPSILAYAYFPGQGQESGHLVFNDDYIWSLSGKQVTVKKAKENGFPVLGTPLDTQLLRTYKIITVLIHELGHSLGLRHDEHGDSDDAMDAYYDGKDDLSKWDIFRIRLKYPERAFKKGRYDDFKRSILKIIKSFQ